MSMTPPSFTTFFLAMSFGVAGLMAKVGLFALAAPYAFWLLAVGWGLLVIGTLLRGL